ncbi:MAG: U32 family peptidase, partial [Clostridia bacterium]|nr:U32 family peptidase [Clostridia bacterium]
MLEILAPAGNAECAEAAINNGANAIYLGFSSFSARQSAENFDEAALSRTIASAHLRGVNVYVAMNTIVKDAEIEEFVKTLLSVWRLGADAIILQDLFLGKRIRDLYPEICLHASTQAGVCSVEGAEFAKECGFSRVILARETPISEIQKIAKIIETEVFVQGALCTCFSGQCYFSSFIGGNSGNRGRCKQPCRKTYSYNREGFEESAYALSLSDLSVGEEIEKYVAAGVTSFKIEGRMRRPEYVGAATRYYRLLLDGAQEKNLSSALSDLKRTYNRGNYTKGLAFSQDKRFLSPLVQGHMGEKVGVIKVVNGKYAVESSFRPRTGDGFKILREGKEVGGAFFEKNIQRGFTVSSKVRLKNGDGVFVTTDQAVNER